MNIEFWVKQFLNLYLNGYSVNHAGLIVRAWMEEDKNKI